MYGMFTYIGIILNHTLGVNVGKYSIHGSSGIVMNNVFFFRGLVWFSFAIALVSFFFFFFSSPLILTLQNGKFPKESISLWNTFIENPINYGKEKNSTQTVYPEGSPWAIVDLFGWLGVEVITRKSSATHNRSTTLWLLWRRSFGKKHLQSHL